MSDEERLSIAFATLDPSGRAQHGWGLVKKYRPVIERQHRLLFEAWRAHEHPRSLAELHFFLIAMDRIVDGLKLLADWMGAGVATHVQSRDFALYKDARNHFEHLEDRLFGTGHNAPLPVTENGATRTIHYGLRGADQHFRWGVNSVDISDAFLSDFVQYVDAVDAILLKQAGIRP